MGTPDVDGQIVAFYLQHMVALNIAWETPDGARHREVYSCFVLEVRGEWFLVTAGHSLADLYSALPTYRWIECSLFDAWHEKANRIPVPFPLLGARHFVVDEDGLDLGLIHIEL